MYNPSLTAPNEDLLTFAPRTLTSIELFAGAGGLAMGFSEHGVAHRAVVEWNAHACNTIRHNKLHKVDPISHWPDVTEGDVKNFKYGAFEGIDLITGGPPCQPFSMGGKHGGFLDERDMFPQAIRAVREARPRTFVFENVQGLTRAAFADYFDYILLQLEFPSLMAKPKEQWGDHLTRLRKWQQKPGITSEYNVTFKLVNAANYGVPQKRMRVFFVGIRGDEGKVWEPPAETHSSDALLLSQWGSSEYWERHKVATRQRPSKPAGAEKKISALIDTDYGSNLLAWRTVRDAIADLPDPERFPGKVQAHRFQPGARIYPGHTGSPLDEPAKALKAGDHGVPGGENMLRRVDGSVRYFTVRESARIQTFPDAFLFEGTWGEIMRQLGNAVPVHLASVMAKSVCDLLRE
ncbi:MULTISPECIES: DNA cytosine methyltransferase [unclassified Duganella]|uniref:DNA cytosine methyltransferase n=1 Tax=unclassified Duganella TaxID=2636909 RepID=UPI00088ED612|nr:MULTISPECIES: DNA cytosine methyltransferase [unclassified Duganella]SDH48926.1 DNA (cytosine-5)-methyltransferase 1 [Duganella sp. OV458]SDK64385.1 DNA (cytosine-5)-methyltransferase 1 [Duganella sp. OV510]